MNQPSMEISVECQWLFSTTYYQEELCQQHKEAEFLQPLKLHLEVLQDAPSHPALPEPIKLKQLFKKNPP